MQLDPIAITHFPPNRITFHLSGYPTSASTAKTEIYVEDSVTTLLMMREHFLALDPVEQRNFIIALITERL